MTGQAWMLLPSGRQLDLLALHPCARTDRGKGHQRWLTTWRGSRPDPEAVRRVAYEGSCPGDRPFPLTPLDAWHVLLGRKVAPVAGTTLEQALLLPGNVEAGSGGVRLWHS